jgi:phosphoribosyl 1,2-cyclic phosphate phosphodiesterase
VQLTFLGTGTSFGVPQVGCGCRTCQSTDPRDRRMRSSVLVEDQGRRVLIDTGPELRLQLIAAGVTRLDAVLYTHSHADHVHGIDDLRALSMRLRGEGLPVYGPAATLDEIRERFAYIFDGAPARPGTSKPQLRLEPLTAECPAAVGGLTVLPIALPHGDQVVFGYRFGRLAYLTDVKAVPPAARDLLSGLDVLVLNALLPRPHPLHLSIEEAVATAQALGARRTLLTHLAHEVPHAALAATLPDGIEPAYDGLVVEVHAV